MAVPNEADVIALRDKILTVVDSNNSDLVFSALLSALGQFALKHYLTIESDKEREAALEHFYTASNEMVKNVSKTVRKISKMEGYQSIGLPKAISGRIALLISNMMDNELEQVEQHKALGAILAGLISMTTETAKIMTEGFTAPEDKADWVKQIQSFYDLSIEDVKRANDLPSAKNKLKREALH